MRGGSNGVRASLAGPDPDRLLHGEDEDLAITDATGVGRLHDGLHDLVDHVVPDRDLELDLRKEIHHVLRPPVELGVPLLSAESLDLGDRHSLDTQALQGLLDGPP